MLKNMCKYCKDKGMTLQEYQNFKQNIKVTAQAIKSQLVYKGGVYYPTSDIINYNSDDNIKAFIIQELKNLGLEFYDNNNLYRVTE